MNIDTLEINEGNKNDYKELETIVRYLYLNAECVLPELKSVWKLYLNAKCKLPKLKTVDYLYIHTEGVEIPHIFDKYYLGMYKYHAVAYFDKQKKQNIIRMGCFARTVEQWDADFWNNPKEFPNDGRPRSVERWEVYQDLKTKLLGEKK